MLNDKNEGRRLVDGARLELATSALRTVTASNTNGRSVNALRPFLFARINSAEPAYSLIVSHSAVSPMGRTTGRTRRSLPLARQTTQELIRAVNRDFQGQAMEQSARRRLRERLADIGGAGQKARLEPSADGGLQAVPYEPYEPETVLPRTPEQQRRIDNELKRLARVLRRPRAQPKKYPELDAAMVAAVARGESPAAVVTEAIEALRLARPELRATNSLRRQFLDRIKKRRRRQKSVD